MKDIIANIIIAILFFAIGFAAVSFFASCSSGDRKTIEAKAKQISQLHAQLTLKRAEVQRLKSDIAKRDEEIGRLSESLLVTSGENADLKDQAKQLSELNLRQKQELDAQAKQLRAIHGQLRAAKRDRDLWSDKFHTQIHNFAQAVRFKDGIIERQKKAIEEQNEMLIKHIQQRDGARICCSNASKPHHQGLPRD